MIDIIRLRKDLEDYFTSIMFCVNKAALVDLSKILNASDEEIIKIAIENGFNLDDYMVE